MPGVPGTGEAFFMFYMLTPVSQISLSMSDAAESVLTFVSAGSVEVVP